MKKEILQYMKEGIRDNISHFPNEFWNIHNDKTVCSWGWTEPLSYIVEGVTYRIVWLSFSPAKKGEQGGAYFDYIIEEEYQQGLSDGKGEK